MQSRNHGIWMKRNDNENVLMRADHIENLLKYEPC